MADMKTLIFAYRSLIWQKDERKLKKNHLWNSVIRENGFKRNEGRMVTLRILKSLDTNVRTKVKDAVIEEIYKFICEVKYTQKGKLMGRVIEYKVVLNIIIL
jgi:hypothetical protein